MSRRKAKAVNVEPAQWYTASEAAKRLSANSHRPVRPDYVHKLAVLGKIEMFPLSSRVTLYRKTDVDKYVVEARGVKSGQAKQQKARQKKHEAAHMEQGEKEAT